MRKKQQKRLMTGLLTAAGAVGAFFGGRALISYLRRRSYEQQYSYSERQPLMGMDYSSSMAGRMSEATSMSQAAGVPVTSGMHSSTPMVEGDYTPTTDMPAAGVTSTGRTEVGENYSKTFGGEKEHPFQTEPPRQSERDEGSIPTTGMMGAAAVDTPRTYDHMRDTDMVETDQPVMVGSLVGPLVVHLLSFHNMINLLQQRRKTEDAAASNVNLPDVRAGGADAISSLEAQLPEFDHAALVPGSLQEGMFRMMERIRDLLQNTDISEDDLFRFSDELRAAACKLLNLIHRVQADNVTGFEDVQQAYNCR